MADKSERQELIAEIEGLEKRLGGRQLRFVAALERGLTLTQAAAEAGYSERSARSQGSRLMKNDDIAALRRARARLAYLDSGVSREKLICELLEIKDRCMKETPHLVWDSDSREWVPDGTWMFDSNGAVKAIKQIAELEQLTKMNIKAELSGAVATPQLSPDEARELLEEIAREFAGGDKQ